MRSVTRWTLTCACAILVLGALAGCGPAPDVPPSMAGGQATPTTSPHFALLSLAPTATPTPRPTATPTPVALPTATLVPALSLAPVYSDSLQVGWTVTESWGVELDLAHAAGVSSGRYAIAVTPQEDFGALFFSVQRGAPAAYLRDRTLGVRFLLGAGEEPLYPEDLAVAVVGSNAYTYWREDDASVFGPEEEVTFSETRLYFLDVRQALLPGYWVEIEIWLDDLEFDPDYQLVTGVYIKNAAGLRQTFYVDQLSLVMLED